MVIKRIEIKNLWQKGNIQWDVYPDVSVLVGENGTGKSTVFNLVYEALQPRIREASKLKFGLIDEMTIELEGDKFVYIDSLGERTPSDLTDYGINISQISTFDISGSLNKLIADLRLPFEIYQKNQLEKMQEIFLNAEHLPTLGERDKIFGKKNLFVNRLNGLFKGTGKSFSEKNFSFKLEGQSHELTHEQLSSGEKQIFYILLNVLLQDGQPCLMLLDEPEISLDLDWQNLLISYVRELNDNCQLLVVTHSPSIYFKGWEDRMKRIEEIKTQRKEGLSFLNLATTERKITAEIKLVKSKGWTPQKSLNHVNSFIHREFFMLSLKDCKKIADLLKVEKLEPDTVTYTTLIAKVTTKKDAESLLSLMIKDKIPRNEVTYLALMKKTDSVQDAMEVFDRMRKEKIQAEIRHFGTMLGKAKTAAEASEVENLRELAGAVVTEIYANKLRIKQ